MKNILFITFCILTYACHSQTNMSNENFTAQRFSKTASITIYANIETVFPLFGAFEEKKWADGWSPVLVYPSSEEITEGLTFKTVGHVHGEKENTWVITKYDSANHFIQYFIIAANRYLTITVQCSGADANLTNATITYSFTGLSDEGNEISQHILSKMYMHNLTDWEEAVNYYLQTGKTLKAHE